MTQAKVISSRTGLVQHLALAILFALLSSCVTQNVRNARQGRTPPIVAAQGALAPAKADALLESALGDLGGDPGIRTLIEDVRHDTSAPLSAGNLVTLLIDGPRTFESIRSAIQSAQHSVHVETYIFSDDELGSKFADLLIEKRQQGVAVRVIYDGIGSMNTPDAFFDRLRDNGIEVREFRPLNPIKTPLLWKINNRDHRKIVVVDGVVAFTGGINISGAYSSSPSAKPGPDRGVQEGWRDTHVRIEGPAVVQLQKLFLDIWERAGEDDSTSHACGEDCFPTPSVAGKQLVTIIANDGDDPGDRSLYATYLAAFQHASTRIWITQGYFAPNEDLLKALTTAVKRGVDVRLIVPGFTDSGLILHASRSNYTRLLKGGVHIYERTDALLHAKTAVIDGVLSVVGSANLDMRSFVHNNEVDAIVVGREFAQRMEEMYLRDEQVAQALDLKTWKQRSMWERLKEFGSSLVGYWL